MTTTAIRKKLQDYIRVADDKKLKAIYTILEDQISGSSEWWKDKMFIKEMDNRDNALESGKDKGVTIGQLKTTIDKLGKKNTANN